VPAALPHIVHLNATFTTPKACLIKYLDTKLDNAG
jgi:hypothetical protein